MTAFRVLVVDDEPLARQVAVGLLRGDGEIDQIEECADGITAQDAITRLKPDIVFLDIEMPGHNGLEVAAGSRDTIGPVVVFTTAFGHYALDAFDVAAIDYVLKPYSDERFRGALARAKRRVRERRLGDMARELIADDERRPGKASARSAGLPASAVSARRGSHRRPKDRGHRLVRGGRLLRSHPLDPGAAPDSRLADIARVALGSRDVRPRPSHGHRQRRTRARVARSRRPVPGAVRRCAGGCQPGAKVARRIAPVAAPAVGEASFVGRSGAAEGAPARGTDSAGPQSLRQDETRAARRDMQRTASWPPSTAPGVVPCKNVERQGQLAEY